MKRWSLLYLTAVGILTISTTGRSQSIDDVRASGEPLVLESQGSFFVGGKTVTVKASGWKELHMSMAPGEVMNQQMYVQFQKPKTSERHLPIVFIHGCCLTSKTWETTPDGRMGWYEYFTRKGHATYLADQVGRGRSALNGEIFNEVRSGHKPPSALPPVLVGTREMVWTTFRFGPRVDVAWPDEQFPVDHVADLQKQMVPDFILYQDPNWVKTYNTPATAGPTVERLASLAASLEGAILIGHSQSSPWPAQAALLERGGVRGIVGLETGCLSGLKPEHVRVLAAIPILIVVGDHFPDAESGAQQCLKQRDLVNAAGGDMTFLSLPAVGVHGNSHMMMQDRNNLQVADVILDWIDKHVENRGGSHLR